METAFGFGKTVDLGFDQAIDKVTEELGSVLSLVDEPRIEPLAGEVRSKLERVMEAL